MSIIANHQKIIGLLPAGGEANRIAPLPCSKELYPVGFRAVDEDEGLRPKVVCHYLLEKIKLAGATQAYIVLRQGKWDIPGYLGDGALVQLPLAYLMMNLPYGAPYTVDQAYPFIRDATIVFGFPDILFQPEDAFKQLLIHQNKTAADVVLGLFPADNPQKMDMVDLDETGNVRRIVIKPPQTQLRYTWIIAVWTPVFTHFMHEYLVTHQDLYEQSKRDNRQSAPPELYVGHVIQAAIDNNLLVETVLFPQGRYLDIGTPDDLVKAAQTKGLI